MNKSLGFVMFLRVEKCLVDFYDIFGEVMLSFYFKVVSLLGIFIFIFRLENEVWGIRFLLE